MHSSAKTMRNIPFILFSVSLLVLFPGCESPNRVHSENFIISHNFDRAPVPIFVPQTGSQPFLADQRGSGAADVSFKADATGHVVDAKVIRATKPEFGNAALASIRRTVFSPALVNGVAVPFEGGAWFRFDSE